MIPEFLLFFIRIFTLIGILQSSYKLVGIFPVFYRLFPFFIGLFSTQKKGKIYFPFFDPFLLLPSSLFTFLISFFYLSLTTCVKGEIIQTFIIMHNYEIMIVIILGNLKIYVVKLKKSENNSAPSWFRTRALVVRRLERRSLTCEIIATALRLSITWPTAWDAPFSYEFYFEKPCCCWWNHLPTVKKQICFSKCRFYIAKPSVLPNDFI